MNPLGFALFSMLKFKFFFINVPIINPKILKIIFHYLWILVFENITLILLIVMEILILLLRIMKMLIKRFIIIIIFNIIIVNIRLFFSFRAETSSFYITILMYLVHILIKIRKCLVIIFCEDIFIFILIFINFIF